jgi:hypothetical protein
VGYFRAFVYSILRSWADTRFVIKILIVAGLLLVFGGGLLNPLWWPGALMFGLIIASIWWVLHTGYQWFAQVHAMGRPVDSDDVDQPPLPPRNPIGGDLPPSNGPPRDWQPGQPRRKN